MNYQTTSSINEETKKVSKKNKVKNELNPKPTSAYIGASWGVLMIGLVSYCIGLWNASMELNEKGYYFSILLMGIYAVISLQKAVRDKAEEIKVSEMYYGISWVVVIAAILLLIIGLRNADLLLSEKGFYGISFLLSLFGAITVQKNTRDIDFINNKTEEEKS
ncbi:YiaA/YiaB family protein [Polaribacter sp. Z014]|uniref:inner membrane protein YiaA n=1 Tax=unclassified Polaribacter TaxID=196858 RepID=UPI00193BD119|nr:MULTISPECIES: inner membrane protein YiaA [unclassified Polaribacter]MCL7763806.1 YiaA/YiaB family protein [Polaribacter sp. Z014]QVY66536.1 YiaA/YiaB family protein [Polaribacter sp. Q13]